MNPNGTHDYEQTNKLDSLQNNGQTSGDALMDELAFTMPKANERFQHQLEERLIAQLEKQQQRSKDIDMQTTNAFSIQYSQNKPMPFHKRIPVTLVAAMLMLVIGGGTLLFMSIQPPQMPAFLAQDAATATPLPTLTHTPTPFSTELSTPIPFWLNATPTATIAGFDATWAPTVPPPFNVTATIVPFSLDLSATPIAFPLEPSPTFIPLVYPSIVAPPPVQPVVTALTDMPRGTLITKDMLVITYWPIPFAPRESYTDLENIIGQITRQDIARWQPIVGGMISTTLQGNNAARSILPAGTVAVSFEASPANGVSDNFAVGDDVLVIATVLFVDINDKFQGLSPTSIPLDLEAVTATPIAVTASADSMPKNIYIYGELVNRDGRVFTLAVPPADATLIVWLVESKVPLEIVKEFGK